MTYFHATYPDYTESIAEEGIRADFMGMVYCCSSKEDAIKMMAWRLRHRVDVQAFQELQRATEAGEDISQMTPPLQMFDTFVVIEFEADEAEESGDHNRAFIDVDAFMCPGPITPERIVAVHEYEFLDE